MTWMQQHRPENISQQICPALAPFASPQQSNAYLPPPPSPSGVQRYYVGRRIGTISALRPAGARLLFVLINNLKNLISPKSRGPSSGREAGGGGLILGPPLLPLPLSPLLPCSRPPPLPLTALPCPPPGPLLLLMLLPLAARFHHLACFQAVPKAETQAR